MRKLLIFLIILAGCGHHHHHSSRRLGQPATWTLHAEHNHDDIAAIISQVVTAFHQDHHHVTRIIDFVAVEGKGSCGSAKAKCKRHPGTIEFDPDWTSYEVAHELFHEFAEDLGSNYPDQDKHHQDPRWDKWNKWRDNQH